MNTSKIMAACVGVLLFIASTASAQTRPALSPWLSLYNNNRGGVLDNYHTFVAPQMQIQKDFQQQGQQIQRQQTEQRTLEDQINKTLNAPKKRASYSPQNGAGYRQYLHYYDAKSLPQGGPPYHGKRR